MKRLTFIMLAFMVLSGCSNSLPKMPEMPKLPKFSMPSWTKASLPSIDIYKPTILQGSILDIKDVDQLELGMSKSAVMDLIGSPSISDPFHKYQWDYINHSTIDGELSIHYHLKLVFSGDVLSEIDKSGLDGLSSNQ
jgi:outer membrane protein assembly factor BamE